jgi:hypothetical protein
MLVLVLHLRYQLIKEIENFQRPHRDLNKWPPGFQHSASTIYDTACTTWGTIEKILLFPNSGNMRLHPDHKENGPRDFDGSENLQLSLNNVKSRFLYLWAWASLGPECSRSSLYSVFKTLPQVGFLLNTNTPWPESASKLYLPCDRRLSVKLVPTFPI